MSHIQVLGMRHITHFLTNQFPSAELKDIQKKSFQIYPLKIGAIKGKWRAELRPFGMENGAALWF